MSTATPTSHTTQDEIIIERAGRIGIATLNRPKALNSLNLNMVDKLYETYQQWESDKTVQTIILKSNGNAFCAGGDVRAIYTAGKEKLPLRSDFFIHEYKLNHLIYTLQKPHIALLNGVTMGGGAGISIHGHFRVATENTVFAMPEVGIGFAPDVGVTHFLSRLPKGIGHYLALTGNSISATDLKLLGFATHYIKSSALSALQETLQSIQAFTYHDYMETLKLFEDASPYVLENFNSLAPHLSTIERCFTKATVREILDALSKESSDFAKSTLTTITTKACPISVYIAHEMLMRAAKYNMHECLQMEYTVVQNSLVRFREISQTYKLNF